MHLSTNQKFVVAFVIGMFVVGIGLLIWRKTQKRKGGVCPKGTGIDAWHTLTGTHAEVDPNISICNDQFYYNGRPTCIAAGVWNDACPTNLACTPGIKSSRNLSWNTGQHHCPDKAIIGYTARGLDAVQLAILDPNGVIVECPTNS